MKKIIALLFLITVIIVSCKSNKVPNRKEVRFIKAEVNYIPYYLKVYEADSLFIIKEYNKSYSILDSLFKVYTPLNLNIYNEALNYLKLKVILKKDIKENEFLKLISFYGFNKEFLVNDSILNSSKKLRLLLSKYDKQRAIYIGNIDLKLRSEIKEMKCQDQFYRKNDYKLNIDRQTDIDLKNQKRLIEIFNKCGFPSKNIIGGYDIDNDNIDITVMLLHTKDSIRRKYFMPKVLEYIKHGEASPELYANLYDQLLLYNGDEQYYGSYENKAEITINELNKRRRKIGLPNYGYQKWRISKLYPND